MKKRVNDPEFIKQLVYELADEIAKSHFDNISSLKLDKILDVNKISTCGYDDVEKMITERFIGYCQNSMRTRCGNLMERLAEKIVEKYDLAMKSSANGIDFEMVRDINGKTIRYVIQKKLGEKSLNKDQQEKLDDNMKEAVKRIKQSNSKDKVICILGAYYGGKNQNKESKSYIKLTGQSFWFFLTGIVDMHRKVPMWLAERNKSFQKQLKIVEKEKIKEFVSKFNEHYVDGDGNIDWGLMADCQASNLKGAMEDYYREALNGYPFEKGDETPVGVVTKLDKNYNIVVSKDGKESSIYPWKLVEICDQGDDSGDVLIESSNSEEQFSPIDYEILQKDMFD